MNPSQKRCVEQRIERIKTLNKPINSALYLQSNDEMSAEIIANINNEELKSLENGVSQQLKMNDENKSKHES